MSALAVVADALLADGRRDLAAHIVSVMFYCAERGAAYRDACDNIVPLQHNSFGTGRMVTEASCEPRAAAGRPEDPPLIIG